jgi:hypothetical protein
VTPKKDALRLLEEAAGGTSSPSEAMAAAMVEILAARLRKHGADERAQSVEESFVRLCSLFDDSLNPRRAYSDFLSIVNRSVEIENLNQHGIARFVDMYETKKRKAPRSEGGRNSAATRREKQEKWRALIEPLARKLAERPGWKLEKMAADIKFQLDDKIPEIPSIKEEIRRLLKAGVVSKK